MTKISNDVLRLAALFDGFKGQHGTHGQPDLDPNGLKWAIKRTAKTLREPVTEELWAKHVKGERPLGVVPIREDSLCSWGSIDIDEYDIDILEVVDRVEKMKLPLVPCRSKSGGLHLFLFLKTPTGADRVQAALRDIAASIGFAKSEIFPKQTKIDATKGDLGNWMVMPYFGGTFGGKLKYQYGVKKTGAEQTLGEFVAFAESKAISDEELSLIRVKKPRKEKVPFSDGPVCLQHMAEGGFPEGGRNNALFHLGVYLKKAQPNDWQQRIEADNQRYMKPPLSSDEVLSVIRSLERKEYEYKCKDQPMSSHCDSAVCRSRKFGVGGGSAYPEITGLRKLKTEPAMWFVDIPGHTLSMSTEELQNYVKFHRQCIEHANTCYRMLNVNEWINILNDAMTNLEEIPASPDIGISGIFREYLESFLTNRTRGESIDDLLRGAPWEDEENKCHWFRLADLQKFLDREKFKMSRAEITERIRKLGGGKKFDIVKKRGINMWFVPSTAIESAPELSIPKEKREVI